MSQKMIRNVPIRIDPVTSKNDQIDEEEPILDEDFSVPESLYDKTINQNTVKLYPTMTIKNETSQLDSMEDELESEIQSSHFIVSMDEPLPEPSSGPKSGANSKKKTRRETHHERCCLSHRSNKKEKKSVK